MPVIVVAQPPLGDLLMRPEVCTKFDISPSTLVAWCEQGFPHVRMGSKVYFSARAIEEWLYATSRKAETA